MTAFSSPFARRRRDTKAKSMQPIDTTIAQLYNQAGPCSAPLLGLLSPSESSPDNVKSPLRRAFGRLGHGIVSRDVQASSGSVVCASRPVRPVRAASRPESCLAPRIDAFAFSSAPSPQPIAPLIITRPVDGSRECQRRSFFGRGSALGSTSSASVSSSSSPRPSLRSLRQNHTRRSIQSIFDPTLLSLDNHLTKLAAPKVPLRSPLRPRLNRRVSEESFHCRGLGFDGPPAAESTLSLDKSCYSAPAMVRSISLYAESSIRPSRPRCMSKIWSYHSANPLQEWEDEEIEKELAGLGLGHCLGTSEENSVRLSCHSQVSLVDSVSYSLGSNGSTDSLTSLETHYHDTWPKECSSKEMHLPNFPFAPASVRAETFSCS